MAIKRVGNTRMNDNPGNTWNAAATNEIPGDVLSGAPGFGGQTLREAPGPIITEVHMVAEEHQKAPTRAKASKEQPTTQRGKKPRTRAVLPPDAKRFVVLQSKEATNRVAINLRMPKSLLNSYKSGGKGYQTRIIAVLELFLEEGGQFIEI